MTFNGERCKSKTYLYAGGVSLEGVDDGHVSVEKWNVKEGVFAVV